MVDAGKSSEDIELRVGSNDITIVVTSPAMTTKTYTVTVTRAAEITLPTPPPPPPLSLYEQQTMRNEQASAVIRNATDARTVSEQVKQVVDQLSELIESNELSDAEKWDLITDTVNKVYAAVVAKWEEEVVDHSQLSNSVNALLEQVMQPLLSEMSGESETSIEKAKESLSSLIQTVVAKLDKNQLSDRLIENLNNAFTTFLAKISSVHVAANEEVDHLPEQFDQLATIIDSFKEQLDEKASLFNLEKNLTITVLEQSLTVKNTNIKAKAEVKPIVTLSRTVVEELISQEFGVSIVKREGAGIQLPPKLLKEIGNISLKVTIAKLTDVTLPSNVANASDAYEYTMQAEGENGTIYQSSNKKVATVSKDGLVTIEEDAKAGARATITVKNGRKSVKISVAVPRIISLTVSPKKASVEPGETLQLTVSAGLSDRSKRDVTKGEAGTIYKIAESDTKYAEINEDGLLQAYGDTPVGAAITITVEYGGKAVDYMVTIKE